MAKLKLEKRPDGQREDYMFLLNEETGTRFKVLREQRTAGDGSPVLAISISPVDAEGHALLNDAGQPDVKHLSHTFTEVELSDPAFDPEARLGTMLDTVATEKDRELVNRERTKGVTSKWGKAALDLGKRVHVNEEATAVARAESSTGPTTTERKDK